MFLFFHKFVLFSYTLEWSAPHRAHAVGYNKQNKSHYDSIGETFQRRYYGDRMNRLHGHYDKIWNIMKVTMTIGHLKRFGGLYIFLVTYVSDYMFVRVYWNMIMKRT